MNAEPASIYNHQNDGNGTYNIQNEGYGGFIFWVVVIALTGIVQTIGIIAITASSFKSPGEITSTDNTIFDYKFIFEDDVLYNWDLAWFILHAAGFLISTIVTFSQFCFACGVNKEDRKAGKTWIPVETGLVPVYFLVGFGLNLFAWYSGAHQYWIEDNIWDQCQTSTTPSIVCNQIASRFINRSFYASGFQTLFAAVVISSIWTSYQHIKNIKKI
jgi:hypothetical protein